MCTLMDNVTLGMVKYLEKLPCVNSVTVVERQKVEETSLISWEQKNKCLLPVDLKNFYLVTDGIQVKWSWKMKGDAISGGITEIVPLGKLRQINPKWHSTRSNIPNIYDIESDSGVENKETTKPSFRENNRMFVLDYCQGSGKVCFVYSKKKEINADVGVLPSEVWFLDRSFEWHYLASDFSSYFRLALTHLGVPHWQYLYTPSGPPPKTKQLLYMLAPERMTRFSN